MQVACRWHGRCLRAHIGARRAQESEGLAKCRGVGQAERVGGAFVEGADESRCVVKRGRSGAPVSTAEELNVGEEIFLQSARAQGGA